MAVRKEHSFFECCQTPALASEITLQPIRRYTGLLDAAIILYGMISLLRCTSFESHIADRWLLPLPFGCPAQICTSIALLLLSYAQTDVEPLPFPTLLPSASSSLKRLA